MINFHEHKLWQASYVALMDLHNTLDDADVEDHDKKVIEDLLTSAQSLAALIADALTRQDKRTAGELIQSSVGGVAMTRTHLAVAWGRGLLDDVTFKKLDESYASLSSSLQSFR